MNAIILLGNGPGAMALTVIRSAASVAASLRVSMWTAALLAPYEKLSVPDTTSPSIDPTLITRAGSVSVAAARRLGSSAWVSMNTPLTLMSKILSNPAAGNSSIGAPHVAPALFTSTSSRGEMSATRATRPAIPSSVDRSAGWA
ncbi:hypothetical protein MLGJGCBP_02009 [Rhodococcus sp. T7]|nr:hypothetical protein MLGJGCBP_02009 [Rhodococcus sp. T7]